MVLEAGVQIIHGLLEEVLTVILTKNNLTYEFFTLVQLSSLQRIKVLRISGVMNIIIYIYQYLKEYFSFLKFSTRYHKINISHI